MPSPWALIIPTINGTHRDVRKALEDFHEDLGRLGLRRLRPAPASTRYPGNTKAGIPFRNPGLVFSGCRGLEPLPFGVTGRRHGVSSGLRRSRPSRRTPPQGAHMKMIDVGAKPKTERVAIARGRLTMGPETVARVRAGEVEKGDVIAAARLAGVMAAKRTPDLIPLCHPIALSGVEVEIELEPAALAVTATVRTVDRTGVEMEALSAVAAACLTAYDMLKRYERGMRLEAIELIEKRGGRSGVWVRPRAASPDRPSGTRSRSPRTPAGRRPPTARPARAGRRRAAGPAGRRR